MGTTLQADKALQYLERGEGERIAFQHHAASSNDLPGILFCPGFHSDMQGDKALYLQEWCSASGRQFTRFDYFGHGQSSGEVLKGRIGRWRDDTIAILDEVTEGAQIIVGSSMGGWMMLLAAIVRPERIAGLVGIAAAPDFTRLMLASRFDSAMLDQLNTQGYVDMPNRYDDGEPYRIEKGFIEEAESHILLDAEIAIDVPVRLLHGQLDADVPWQRSLEIAERIHSRDVEVQLVKDGDHRLSRPQDLVRLRRTIESVSA